MKSLIRHLPILLLLQAIVFVFFGRVLTAPLWHPLDFQILYDAEMLSRAPLAPLRHIGSLVSQPVLQFLFLLEYRLFGLAPGGYYAVNLAIHALNAFLVYMLVNMLFPRRGTALLASLLFAMMVGNYGKILLSLQNLEHLLLAHLYLLTLYAVIRNDFRHQGRLRSAWFLCALGLFFIAGLTKPVTFSLLGCVLAYKFFFHSARARRPIFSADVIVLIVAGALFFLAQRLWSPVRPIGFAGEHDALHFTWTSFKNVFRYLTLMVVPLQASPLISRANPVVELIYGASPVIRWFTTLGIVSFSFFGIVFGSRAVRFFIAWTFITVLPFSAPVSASDWLNLKYLYLVSVGYCVILAGGVLGCVALLSRHRFKRLVPLILPLALMAASLLLTHELDGQNRRTAQTVRTQLLRAELEEAIRAPRQP